MSSNFHAPSRGAFLVSLLCSVAPIGAFAAETVIGTGVTSTDQQTLSGTDKLSVEKGGRLDVDDTAIVLDGSSPAPGVVVTNAGTIVATDRAIDTDGDDNPRFISITNAQGASISSENDTIRVDTDVTDGAIVIDNAGALVSTDGQVIDLGSVESKDAVISITNGSTGTITATGNDAMKIGGGTISIINHGLISSIESESRGIDIAEYLNIESVLIENAEGAVIEAHSDAIRIDSDDEDDTAATGKVVLNNAGVIASRGTGEEGGQAIDFDKIGSANGSVTINNLATGEITSADADAVRPGEGGIVNNWGKIISSAPDNISGDEDDDTSNDGIDLQGHSGTVHNYSGALISGARHGITSDVYVDVINEKDATIIGRNGSGVGSDGDGKVVNYGTITGTIDDNSVNGDGDGVDIDGFADITNYGTIEGVGAKGEKDGSPNGSEGIAAGGGTILNLGKAAVISGTDNAILIDDSDAGAAPYATKIVNEGTIEGSDGFGVRLIGDQDDVISNYGTISAASGPAIDMGGGDDTLNIYTGSTIIGMIDGGDGEDTITLNGTGTFGGAENFEFLEVYGDWSLTGDQSYSGGVSVTDGSLSVDGTLDAAMVIGAGSLLDGNGTFSTLTVGGTVAPGHSIGTITVTGDYTQTAGSVYEAEFDGTTADLIDVTGTATLAGSVTATPYGGGTISARRYTILSADGGIIGTYELTDSALSAFLEGSLAYDANNVYLDVARNGLSFASAARTDNQRSVAVAIENLGAGNVVYDAVAGSADIETAAAGFNSLSGEFHASIKTALIEDSRFVRDAISARLQNAFGSVSVAGANSADGGTGYGLWGQTFGSWGKNGGDGYADIDRSTGGLMLGADGEFADSWRAGFALGYSHGSFDADDLFSSGDSDSYHAGLYAGGKLGNVGLQAGAAYSWHDISSTRNINVLGFDDELKADYDADTLQVFGEINYDAKAGTINLQPFANLAYVHLGDDDFTERGGAAALTSRGTDNSTTFATVGLRASTDVALGETVASLSGSVAWRHASGDINPSADMSIGGAGFDITGAAVTRNVALVDAGIAFKLSDNATLGVGYSGQFAEDAFAHAAKANFMVKF
jgi:subtilase-type serine protease